MDIVHIASEFAPIAKVGGLGDVTHGLCKALVKQGHRVTLFLPKYSSIDFQQVENLQIVKKEFAITEKKAQIFTTFWSGTYEGIALIFVEPHHPKAYFEREGIYGEEDDNERFLFFCKVSARYLDNNPPDVIHLHDWMTAAAALFLKNGAKKIFTIHNLQHQGRCAPNNLKNLGIEIEEEILSDYQYGESLNLMRGAFAKCDVITTVSPSYREEILTQEYGQGLERDLVKYRKKLKGILNGIDPEYWNPEQDRFLPTPYSIEEVTKGKAANKAYVQKHLSLSQNPEKPLVIAITRLVWQKGPDLILFGIEKTLELGGQFALLGTIFEPDLIESFAPYKDHPDVAIRLDYDEPLSHALYGAGDMLLMPSIFEPCGLAQMIAMHYGTLPLVRKTGGLRDTVHEEENGFLFEVPDNKGVASVLERAFASFGTEKWQEMIQRAMRSDFSWEKSAAKYLELYQS